MSIRRGVRMSGLVIAGVIAGRHGRFGRRAAMRGGLAAAIGAAVTRRRLLGALSGGAAGAAIEVPVVGVPLAIAALATAQPMLADATVLAAGAGIGLATARVWPTAPRTVEELRHRGTKRFVEPPVKGEGVAVLVNTADDLATVLAERAPNAVVLDAGEDVEARLQEAAEQSTAALGAAGGDGTLSAAAALANDRGLPLLALPAGTLNHFARDLGLLEVGDALDALDAGQVIEADLATIGDRTFVNTASFGAYTDLVEAREKLENRIGKWPAVAIALVGVLRRAEPVHLLVDGRERHLWIGFIGNCRYHPSGFAPTWREELDDRQLDIRLVDAEHPLARVRLLASVLTGRLGRSTVYEQRSATSLELESRDGPISIALDGEVCEVEAKVTVAKRERPVSVFAPHR